MVIDYQKAKAVFLQAVHEVPASEWPAHLDRACEGEPELRRQVEKLLSAHQSQGDVATHAVQSVAEKVVLRSCDETGQRIGPYKLLERIGEGGMGVVYMAQQTEPVKRKVALKLIKPGMDSKQVIARFEAERQALALMDHPNIAKVLDAGSTGEKYEGQSTKDETGANSSFGLRTSSLASAGRPYFVMELVRGVPITAYCDNQRLATRERLALFINVCQAVQHAHLKGIIHRDLKPSNVLVTLHDGTPVVKVIDFGVAKAIGQDLTERTLFTQFSQMVGTPLYMSPEQAEMSGLDIDTRTDVYSLGVLLYELLTGTTPFDKEKLSQAGFDEMRRIIREDEPPRPSARLSTLRATGQSTAAGRQVSDSRQLSRLLRGELDWIVMKALEKDRNRRYESASALANDIQRYVSDEPVQACPPSAAYRFRKFARKNKGALTTVALVAASLLIGTVASAWQAVEANAARQGAQNNLQLANQRLSSEQQARRDAEMERERAERERRRAESERERAESERRRAESERDRAESHARVVEQQRQMLENNQRVSSLVTNEILAVLRDVPIPAAKRKALLVTVLGRLTDLDLDERATAFNAAGNQFAAMKEYAAAMSAFNEGLVIDPQHAGLHIGRGDVYFKQSEFDKAAEDYTTAIHNLREGDPAQALLPHNRRAFARCRQGRFEEALSDFRASYERSPQNTLSAMDAGFRGSGPIVAPFDERLKSGFVSLLDRYVADEKHSLAAQSRVADLLAELKQFAEARKYLENAERAGAHLGVYYRLALLAIQRDDLAEYRRICRKAAEVVASSTDEELQKSWLQGWSHFFLAPDGLDDYSTLIELMKRFLDRRSNDNYCRFCLGAFLYRQGKVQEARPCIERSMGSGVNDQGQHAYGRFLLAMIAARENRSDDAKRLLAQGEQIWKGALHYNWRFQLMNQALSREAKALIEANKDGEH